MKISLAIDNCFAKKRWVKPSIWAPLIKDLGVSCVEASADNEIDPLYSTPAFLDDWTREVRAAEREHGVRVVSLYSGHGTYSTIGLAHHDASVREHLKTHWVRPMLARAGELGAFLGFFAHAFTEEVLADPELYAATYRQLTDDIGELAREAREAGVPRLAIEQMYSPNQVPWTPGDGARFLIATNRGGAAAASPVYLTLDTGHCSGQIKFQAPTPGQLEAWADSNRHGQDAALYLGTAEHYARFKRLVESGVSSAQLAERFEAFRAAHAYLFSQPGDGDPYEWLEQLGAWSPIIHLQQTTGKSSAHLPFTPRHNATGLIDPTRVLQTILASTRRHPEGFPPQVEHLYLTIEIFLATACDCPPALEEIRESVRYWRQFVPEDGMELEAAVEQLNGVSS